MVHNSLILVLKKYREFNYDVDDYNPICCILLDYADAIQPTEDINPEGLWSKVDVPRPMMGIITGEVPYVRVDRDEYKPYSRRRTISFYWRVIIPVVSISNIMGGEEAITFPVTLSSSSSFFMQEQHTVGLGCTYGEFMDSLAPVFERSGHQPWIFQKGLLVDSRPFHSSTIRRFLCPTVVTPEDLQVLCAVHAGPDSMIEHVLHELT
jgi:hypothetical protein